MPEVMYPGWTVEKLEEMLSKVTQESLQFSAKLVDAEKRIAELEAELRKYKIKQHALTPRDHWANAQALGLIPADQVFPNYKDLEDESNGCI